MDHYPLWLLISTDKTDAMTPSTMPVVFSSAEKMAAWLAARDGESRWNLRLLDRHTAADALAELRTRGCGEVYADLDGAPARSMTIAELIQALLAK